MPQYLRTLRAGGVQQIFASIDPRPAAVQALGVADLAGMVDGLLPEVYWPDFQQPAMSCLGLVRSLRALSPNIYPALPYDAAAADLAAFWEACRGIGCSGCSLWRLGAANAVQLQAFGALAVPAANPCAQIEQQLAAVTAERDRLKAAVQAMVAAGQGALAY